MTGPYDTEASGARPFVPDKRSRSPPSRIGSQAADLYALMQRAFRRRQSPGCEACFVQLPFRADRDGEDSPNWEVVMRPPCSYACQSLIEELVAEFGARYDLKTASGVFSPA